VTFYRGQGAPKLIMSFVVQVRSTRNSVLLRYILLLLTCLSCVVEG
jgi:hypothetical protein